MMENTQEAAQPVPDVPEQDRGDAVAGYDVTAACECGGKFEEQCDCGDFHCPWIICTWCGASIEPQPQPQPHYPTCRCH